MDCRKFQQLQVIIRSPELQIPNLALTLNSKQTWGDVKRSLGLLPLPSLFLSFNGKKLDDSSSIGSSGIAPFSTVNLHLKLVGGGGDGGATGAESRDCYLKMYAEKKPDKADPNEKRLSKWTTCALSFEPLKPPCVIDHLGNVFNKEALVKALLAKNLPKPFSSYIKGLKDLISIHLSSGSGSGSGSGSFQCPISGFEFNGNYRFFALSKCGHVLSAKAFKEVKSSACLVCHQEFEEADKIVINGNDDEVAILRDRMLQLKEKEKQKKASKQLKKPKSKQLCSDVASLDSDSSSFIPPALSGTKHAIDHVNSKLPSSLAALPKAKDASAKRFKAVDIAPPNADKKVYASIFTSSKKTDFKETYCCRSLPLGRN